MLQFALVKTPFDHNIDRLTQVESGVDPPQPILVIVGVPTGNMVSQRFRPFAGEAFAQHLVASVQ